MWLKLVEIGSFAQFLGEKLNLDPSVTVVVGKNDCGKTTLVDFLLRGAFWNGALSGATIPWKTREPLNFSLSWSVESHDIKPLEEVGFGNLAAGSTIKFCCQNGTGANRTFLWYANDKLIMKSDHDGWVSPREVVPPVVHISTGSSDVPAREFTARFAETLDEGTGPSFLSKEALLLQLAGMRSETATASDNPLWDKEPPPALFWQPLTEQTIKERLSRLGDTLTSRLQRYWLEPQGLEFKIDIHGSAQDTWTTRWEVWEPNGSKLFGSGLSWFIAFLLQIEQVRNSPKNCLVLIDEPASYLHPSAQKAVARMLEELARDHQVLLTTHSPFLMNWNFPQRIRVLERNYAEMKTHINNKPYNGKGAALPWDPLRDAIGVTLGDLLVLGPTNVLVEGITDQLLLANSSSLLQRLGRTHLPLEKLSIIPYSDSNALRHIIGTAKSRGLKVIVLGDSDEQGASTKKLCEKENITFLPVSDYAERTTGESAIEDVIGLERYIESVNSFYKQFDWFQPLSVQTVQSELGEASLGKYLVDKFKKLDRSFSKFTVTVHILNSLDSLLGKPLDRMEELIKRIHEDFL